MTSLFLVLLMSTLCNSCFILYWLAGSFFGDIINSKTRKSTMSFAGWLSLNWMQSQPTSQVQQIAGINLLTVTQHWDLESTTLHHGHDGNGKKGLGRPKLMSTNRDSYSSYLTVVTKGLMLLSIYSSCIVGDEHWRWTIELHRTLSCKHISLLEFLLMVKFWLHVVQLWVWQSGEKYLVSFPV